MDKHFMPPISIEKFAAYLDGNLSKQEMNSIDALISANPDMEEFVSLADEVDEDVQIYMQDEFAYEADMTALEDSDFDIPNLDADIALHTGDDSIDYRCAACVADAADEQTGIDETDYYNGDNETVDEVFEVDEFQTHQDEDSIGTFNDYNSDNGHEPSDSPLGDNF